MQPSEMERDANGRLPGHSWPGGYPYLYLTRSGDVLCHCCASEDNTSDPAVGVQIHYEGEPERCADCGTEIPSAYGVP